MITAPSVAGGVAVVIIAAAVVVVGHIRRAERGRVIELAVAVPADGLLVIRRRRGITLRFQRLVTAEDDVSP